jgi:F-type H+/Na+-transporting ATPase subunit alpha
VVIIYAGTQGLLDDVEVKDIRAFEDGLYPFMEGSQGQLLADIESKKALDDDLRKRLTGAINEYKQDFKAKLGEKNQQKEQPKEKQKEQPKDQQKQTAGAAA